MRQDERLIGVMRCEECGRGGVRGEGAHVMKDEESMMSKKAWWGGVGVCPGAAGRS